MKVNAMIIGAGRSGTTSLYEYLRQHPAVSFSITKELHYFSIPELYARGAAYFHSLFPAAKDKTNITADTYLLMDLDAPQRIKSYNPAMKFIILLREPVTRAYSNFNYSVNYGHEKKGLSFLETIALETERLKSKNIVDQNNLCHFYGSLYHKHISYWMQFFPREQFIILKTEDLQQDAQAMMEKIFIFLDLDPVQISTSQQFNKASGVKSKFIQQVLLNRDHWLRRSTRFIVKPFRTLIIKSGVIDKISKMNKTKADNKPLSVEDWVRASAYFAEDIKKLDSEFGIRFEEYVYSY